MMDIVGNNKAESDLFREGSHHRNLSVINLTQSLFPKGKNSVTQRRNTQYLVIFKSPMSQGPNSTAWQVYVSQQTGYIFVSVQKDYITSIRIFDY